MSVAASTAVFKHSTSEGAARLVLLALADVAADTGEITAYMRSHSILAKKANCAEGTVRRSISKLVEIGELVVLDAGGGRKSASYRIVLPGIEGAPDEGGPDEHPGGTTRAGTPREMSTHPARDEHPVSTSLIHPPTSSPITAVGDFDAFWLLYPRRAEKAAARAAYAKAVKLATPETIHAGAARYAAETKGRDPDKIKHPTTWLNRQCWDDEPGANASRTARPTRGASAPVTISREGEPGRIDLWGTE